MIAQSSLLFKLSGTTSWKFQFSDNPEDFHTAVENKQSGFGVNTEQMIYHNLTGEIDSIDPNVFIDSLPVSIYAL